MSTEDKYKDMNLSPESKALLEKFRKSKEKFDEQRRWESELVSDIIFAVKLSCMAGEPYQKRFEKLSKHVYQTGDPLLTSEVLGKYEALEDFIRKIEGKDELNAEQEFNRIRALYKTPNGYEARMEKFYNEHPELEGQIIEPVGPLRK